MLTSEGGSQPVGSETEEATGRTRDQQGIEGKLQKNQLRVALVHQVGAVGSPDRVGDSTRPQVSPFAGVVEPQLAKER
jgi:hypothetical protein